jgi:uncharacterized membrane protein YGL010W
MLSPRLQTWFDDYADDHQDRTNRLIHKLAVPAIVFALVAGLPTWPAVGLAALWSGLYLWVDLKLGAVLALFLGGSAALAPWVSWQLGLAVFLAAWILQFIGHYAFEKRSPSFLSNGVQLFVGPLFVAAVLLGVFPYHSPQTH